MSIHYVTGRSFRGKYTPPSYIVLGEEEGSPVRRVFRSKGLAERFKNKLLNTPRTRHVALVEIRHDD